MDFFTVFPNFVILLYQLGTTTSYLTYRFWPLDVDRTIWEISVYFREPLTVREQLRQEYFKCTYRDTVAGGHGRARDPAGRACIRFEVSCHLAGQRAGDPPLPPGVGEPPRHRTQRVSRTDVMEEPRKMAELALPDEFRDLAPWLDWALEPERARTEKREASSMAEIRAFYDAVLPRLEEMIRYLEDFRDDDMPSPRQPHLPDLALVGGGRQSGGALQAARGHRGVRSVAVRDAALSDSAARANGLSVSSEAATKPPGRRHRLRWRHPVQVLTCSTINELSAWRKRWDAVAPVSRCICLVFGPLSGQPHMPRNTADRKTTDSPRVSPHHITVFAAAPGTAVALRLPFQTWLSSRTAWMRMFSSYHSTTSEKLCSTAARKVASASLNASGS